MRETSIAVYSTKKHVAITEKGWATCINIKKKKNQWKRDGICVLSAFVTFFLRKRERKLDIDLPLTISWKKKCRPLPFCLLSHAHVFVSAYIFNYRLYFLLSICFLFICLLSVEVFTNFINDLDFLEFVFYYLLNFSG